MEQYNYDYYYGLEGEQLAIFRIPKILITNKRYKTLSLAAKVLYGLNIITLKKSIIICTELTEITSRQIFQK
ncbi:hypothetical protein [uncultured Robinsoniella sp.]|uniref:hypothetical protein n=1 Tax=uncultured Robinsoniella sp. TaxID=904190 RepID=UPI00374FA20F